MAHKQEKKTTLESVIDESSDFIKKALKIGIVAGLPLLYGFFNEAHIPRAQITTYGFAAGKATANMAQKKSVLDGIVKDAAVGTALSYPLSVGFQGLNYFEKSVASSYGAAAAKAAKAGAMVFGMQPAISTVRTSLYYGLGKKFRENWWPSVKNTFKYLSLIGIANVLFIYKFGLFAQMAASATISYVISLTESLKYGKGNMKNLLNAVNPFTYLSGFASAIGKMARTIYSIPKAFYT